MASLLDLTVQGDVGTITDESQLPKIKLMGPLELYRLWERQSWASHQISLEQDRRDWESLDEDESESMLWGLSAFFVGEERVTNQFSGLVMAAEDKNEEAFLLTQQVDEARHAQHFNRVYEEVFRYDGSFEDRLERAREDLNDDYIALFDGYLVDAHQRAPRRPLEHRGEGRLHHRLPHGDRGDARAHRPALPDRAARGSRDHARAPRGVQEDRPGRAPPRRIRNLVPAAEGPRSRARQARPGKARRDAPGRRRRTRPARLSARRRVRVPRVHQPGDERVRVHGAVAPAEGDRVGLPAVTA